MAKLRFIRASELPKHERETAEAAYRRGYRDGFRVAVYDLITRRSLFIKAERFIYGPLRRWMARAQIPYVQGVDGKWHFDSHYVVKAELPPDMDHSERGDV